MSKILKNNTASPVVISDTGVTIPASGQYLIPSVEDLLWASSSDAIVKISDSTLTVNDGTNDLSISEGVDLIKGLFPKKINIEDSSGNILEMGLNSSGKKSAHTLAQIIGSTPGTTPFDAFYEVQKGLKPKYKLKTYIGYNDSIKNSNFEDVWPSQGEIPFLDVASPILVSSSSALDTYVGGTGAKVVRVIGLDSNWNVLQEDVVLNGVVGTTTTNSFLRINEAIVISAGNLKTNQGKISFIYSGTTYATIEAGDGVLTSVRFSVPANHVAYLVTSHFSTDNSSKGYRINVRVRNNVLGVNYRPYPFRLSGGATLNPISFLPIPQKTDFVIQAKATSSGAMEMGGFVTILLEDLT